MVNVLKAGEICLLVKGLLRSQKSKKYGVLHGKSQDSHPYLELFNSKEDFENYKTGKHSEVKKIDLKHIKTISNQAHSTSKGTEYHMEIRTKKEKNLFLFDSESDYEEWNRGLNSLITISDKQEENSTSSIIDTEDDGDEEEECVTINEMYGGSQGASRFEVEVEDTPLAKMCKINGNRSLLISPTTLAFENVSTRQLNYEFQISWLRRFGKKNTMFTFEIGRQCPNGAGEIRCKSESAKVIHDLVKNNSSSRGETVTPPSSKGISTAQNNVKQVLERKIETDNSISGPALHKPRRHPGLGSGPALIPLNIQKRDSDDENTSPVPDRDKRSSSKSMDGDRAKTRSSGSIKHAGASDGFTKELEHALVDPHHKDSVKTKDKDLKKKESERKKEEKEKKKMEEKKEKERRDLEKKQKEKAKKEEKKLKEKAPLPVPKPVANIPGAYEEVDIINPSSSPSTEPTHVLEQKEDLYDEATPPTTEGPVEYSQPLKRPAHVPSEYSDVKTVKGNAWQSHGRAEDEEEHMEDYSKIKSVREQQESAPPIPVRTYEEEEDDTYNRLDLKVSPWKGGQNGKQESQNIYGTASETKVRQMKKAVPIPKPDYNESDSGESYNDDTYDSPNFDTYEEASNTAKSKAAANSYEEAHPKSRIPEESLYDEVS